MSYKQYEIWIADLSPRYGTEPGKKRPVVIIQTDLLNKVNHPSTVICPITTNVNLKAKILRVNLKKGEGGLTKESDILVDQIRTIDNRRFEKRIGKLPKKKQDQLQTSLQIVLDM